MPTKRTKRARGNVLDRNARAHLVLGCGCNHWSDEDWEHWRQLWNEHGDKLIAEADAAGKSRPFAEFLFGPPGQET